MNTSRIYLKAFKEIAHFEPVLLPVIIAASIVEGVRPFINIYFSSRIISELTGDKSIQTLILLVVVTTILNFVVRTASDCLNNISYKKRSIIHRKETTIIEKKLFDVDFSKLEDSNFQELVHLHKETSEKIHSPFLHITWSLKEFLTGITTIICALALIAPLLKIGFIRTGEGFFHSPYFLVFLIALICAGVGIVLFLSTKNSKLWFQTEESYNKMNRLFKAYQKILDDYKSGKEVRLFKEQKLIETEASHELLTKGEIILNDFADKSAKSSSYIAIVGALIGFGVYLFIGTKGLLGLFPIAALIRYTGAFMQVIQGITSVASTLGKQSEIFLNLEYYFKIINTPNEMQYGNQTINVRDVEITFNNVWFKYPAADHYTLKNINIHIEKGQRLAVVGRNGSGKTTFIKLLCRLYDADKGEILINGVNIKDLTKESCIQLYSVVFQDFQLFSLRLLENITAGAPVDAKRLKECLEESDVYDRVQRMNQQEKTYLYKDIHADGVEISGGEAQKLALARALYKDAPVIVLDEPTAALDPVAEYQVYKNFNNFVGSRTAIYISHRLSSCRFCDEIAVFDKGELKEFGDHSKLISNKYGIYYKLWDTQAKYYV